MIAWPERIEWEQMLTFPYGCRGGECDRYADLLFDGTPYCFGCADLFVERLCVSRELRAKLPPLFEGPFAS